MLKRDHNSQQHDDRDKVASTPLHWHGMTNTAVSLSAMDTCHHLHLPSPSTTQSSDTFCLTFGFPPF